MSPAHYLLFWFGSAGLFLLPGALLARRSALLWKRLSRGERILPAALLSAGVYGLVYLVALSTRPTLDFALTLWLLVLAGLAAWNLADLRKAGRAHPGLSAPRPLDPPGGSHAWLWTVPILGFAWVAMMIEGGSLGFSHDSLDFAGYVHRMLLTSRIDVASGAYPEGGGLAPDPRRGAFHLAAALLCRISGVSPTEMWRVFPTFLVPLALWIFYASFRRLMQSAWVALASLLFFVMATFFTGDHFINNLAYASRLGWVYSWIGLWAVALALDQDRVDHTPPPDWGPRPAAPRRGGRAAWGLAVAGAPILLGIHILSAAQFLISLGAFTWCWALARREPKGPRRMLWLAPLLSAALLAPLLALKLRQSYSAANPLFDHPQGLLYLAGNWTVLGPMPLAAWFGWPGLLGILLALPLLAHFRRGREFAFLAGSTVVPFLIVLNPVAMRVIEGAHAHSLLFRALYVVPYFQVLGWYSVWAWRRLARPDGKRLLAPACYLAVALVFLGLHYREAARAWNTPQILRAALRELPELRSALHALDSIEPRPSVVVSDPITSYAIPAYTRHYAMTPLNQHSSPSDDRTPERIQDSQAILSAYVGIRETVGLLRKYGAQYILVNQSFPRYQAEYYTLISPDAYPRQREKFLTRGRIFEPVYDRGGILIFRYHDPGAAFEGDSLDAPNPFRLLTPEEAAGRSREELARRFGASPFAGPAVGGLELVATRPDSQVFHAGEPVVLHGYWRRTGEPMALPVEAFVRCESPYPDRRFESPLLGRFWRAWYETRNRTVYRFGRLIDPLAAVMPDYLWEPGAVYRDQLFAVCPGNARPGLYRVRVRLQQIPFTPNVRLRDLFTLHDSLEGSLVGEVRIE